MSDEVTVDEAATILGISAAMARHRMDVGRLPYREEDGVRLAARERVLAMVPEEDERRAYSKAMGEDTDALAALAEFGEQTDELTLAFGYGEPVVVRTPGLMSGRACFRGTRVPVETLFVNLAAGDTLDDILAAFPTLNREDLRAALARACDLMIGAAPTVDGG